MDGIGLDANAFKEKGILPEPDLGSTKSGASRKGLFEVSHGGFHILAEVFHFHHGDVGV